MSRDAGTVENPKDRGEGGRTESAADTNPPKFSFELTPEKPKVEFKLVRDDVERSHIPVPSIGGMTLEEHDTDPISTSETSLSE